ncbi:MAG: c-type cytochrome [Deltaproteobacteria bacterium]|nr:MAG: c-type cytochrome [Deltaproteobacteria bacterium]
MKKHIFFALLISSSLFADERLQNHQKAAEIFTNWHFFENGRGMTISPNLSKFMWMLGEDRQNKSDPVTNFIEKRYGFIVKDDKLMGVFNVKYKNMNVGVLGCTACHSGKAAGVFVPGLGNKTIDPYKVGRDTYRIQKYWGWGNRNPDYKYIHEKAMYFSKVTSDTKISSLTRGLVPDSTIKTFFYKDHGIDYPKDMGRAQVKAPHLWGIKQKREAGVFNDGALSGDSYAWIFGAELFASDSGEHLRAVLPKIKWLTDEVLGNLLPPKYPFKIDNNRVNRGKELFSNACLKCHGAHDTDTNGYPIFTAPKVIPKHVVKTDEEKLNAISPEFVRLVETSSLGDILGIKHENVQKGYFAPKLWGIWSRFPYMHNASIPSLYQVMIKPEKRSIIFSMYEAGEEYRFDKENVGLTLFEKNEYKTKLIKAKKGDRDIYYIEREGQSNQGHYFEDKFGSLSHQDRLDIIEYLKTL